MTTTVVEMVTYQLKPETSEAEFAATHEPVNAWLKKQDGFLYRSVSADHNGVLHDLAYWQNMETAKTAGDAFMESVEGQALCGLINMDSCIMRHMAVQTEAMICEEA
ncbi:MAG: antibiotic biosynthesis monooxygenase family protein [Neptuniibacter sp.]